MLFFLGVVGERRRCSGCGGRSREGDDGAIVDKRRHCGFGNRQRPTRRDMLARTISTAGPDIRVVGGNGRIAQSTGTGEERQFRQVPLWPRLDRFC